MSRTRATRRVSKGALNLYPAETDLGWRVIKTTTPEMAAEKVAAGVWHAVYDERGNHLGYQVTATFKTDQELSRGSSSTSITVKESEMNAGTFGKSRTAHLYEHQRISRRRKLDSHALPPEDAIERAIVKVGLWPYPASRIDDGTGPPKWGDRAVRAYPKPSKARNK